MQNKKATASAALEPTPAGLAAREGRVLMRPNEFRRDSQDFYRLMWALTASPFDPQAAHGAWTAFEADWADKVRSDPRSGWAVPWDSKFFDPGQCDNAYAERLSHPLIHACRFGSPEAVAWVCEREGVEPKVVFTGVSDCWTFGRAAASGMAGAFDPLWALAKRLGWGEDLLGDALAAWLMGATDAKGALAIDAIEACAQAVEEMLAANPQFKLPISPIGPFDSALSRAVHSSWNEGDARPEEVVQALLRAAPARAWTHETDPLARERCRPLEEMEPWEARGFGEEALAASEDRSACFEALLDAGFEMPSLERGLEVAVQGRSAKESAAMNVLRARWARKEAQELEQTVGGAIKPRPPGRL
jgi:hypothetical protein